MKHAVDQRHGSVLAVAGLVLVLGWGAATAEPGGAAPTARRHVVDIKGFQFEPAELAVAVGDTVVWINRDFVPHTATADDGTWDSGRLAEDAAWQMIAATQGRQPYVCRFHPAMKGVLVVE